MPADPVERRRTMSAFINDDAVDGGLDLLNLCEAAGSDTRVVGPHFLTLAGIQAERAAALMLPNTRGHLLAHYVVPLLIARIRELEEARRAVEDNDAR